MYIMGILCASNLAAMSHWGPTRRRFPIAQHFGCRFKSTAHGWIWLVCVAVCSGCDCTRQAFTHFPVLHILPDGFNDPGALHSHRDRRGRQRLVQPLSAQQLGEVHPARLDAHQDLSCLQLRLALGLHLQLDFVVAPVPRQHQGPVGDGALLGCRAAPGLLRGMCSSRRRLVGILLLLSLLLLSWSLFSRHDDHSWCAPSLGVCPDQWFKPVCAFPLRCKQILLAKTGRKRPSPKTVLPFVKMRLLLAVVSGVCAPRNKWLMSRPAQVKSFSGVFHNKSFKLWSSFSTLHSQVYITQTYSYRFVLVRPEEVRYYSKRYALNSVYCKFIQPLFIRPSLKKNIITESITKAKKKKRNNNNKQKNKQIFQQEEVS